MLPVVLMVHALLRCMELVGMGWQPGHWLYTATHCVHCKEDVTQCSAPFLVTDQDCVLPYTLWGSSLRKRMVVCNLNTCSIC
jgi:hypothetical protein